MTPTESATATDEQAWDISTIVASLREIRNASLSSRHRTDRPVKLPSRKAITSVMEGLVAALFPHRMGSRTLSDECVDYFVGYTLDIALRELTQQVERELVFLADDDQDQEFNSQPEALRATAEIIVRKFAECLPDVRVMLETDVVAACLSDTAAQNADEVLACYPGLTAIVYHRLAHVLFQLQATLTARIIAEIAHSITGVEIHPGATIGEGFFIVHGTGIIIGPTAVIGRRVRLYHGVTLGAKRNLANDIEMLSECVPRHPRIEDDVVIYAGATLLGNITIGHGSIIGGNVWLTRSVPPRSVITQAQLQSEEFDDGSGI